MSENHERDETLLPDDAERKIEELMAALKESEREMMGGDEKAQESVSAEDAFDPEEDFLDEGEGDFVDLDAEQVDNTADTLRLDEGEEVEEELLEQLTASVTPSEEELQAQAEREALESQAAEQRVLEANELAKARLDELEEKLAAVAAKPLRAPSYRERRDSVPGWVTATLALLAVVLSATALWFNLNTPSQEGAATSSVSTESARRELQGLKVDMAALRERLAAVERQAESGSEEAVAMLERMQTVLVRMEQKIATTAKEAGIELDESAAKVPEMVEAEPVPDQITAPEPVPATPPLEASGEGVEEEAASAPMPEAKVTAAKGREGKVFVKGWAVNLRSFYHRPDAERLMRRYQGEGIDAEIREIPKGETTWYRVRVMGFDSKEEANAFIEGLSAEQGRDMAWPSFYQGYVDG